MKYNRKRAFGSFRTELTNPYWSHCALSRDGKRLALTCWSDRFEWQKDKAIYKDRVRQDNSPGARELMRNLVHARDQLDGKFNVVMAIPEDPTSDPRRIKECYPRKFVMRLVHLDVDTGEFIAESEAA